MFFKYRSNYLKVDRETRCCLLAVMAFLIFASLQASAQTGRQSWIRINQLGYPTGGTKVAVLASKQVKADEPYFELIDATTSKPVFRAKLGKDFGHYGPFASCYRLSFTSFKKAGRYYLKVGTTTSPVFVISNKNYKGAADFTLRYMRQQRSGFNPFLKDSCHTKDGYVIYGPVPDGTHIDVSGGWHDATDYLQYATTSANATFHLLAAYHDFPGVFTDQYQGNGLEGKNGVPDVLDEGKWGLDWLMKMHPRADWMFNQLADDRDHSGFRLPTKDSVDYGYGKGNGRPVYFLTGSPQGLGKYKNRATGTASTAGKFTSAFALGSMLYHHKDQQFSQLLKQKALSAYQYGLAKPGVAQTAPNLAPYFYEEDNWVDDMELGAAMLYQLTGQTQYLTSALGYGNTEKVTPWMGADTARHYQWYPFHNFGHYEIGNASKGNKKQLMISYYKRGIERVWQKAKHNAFYRGVPFIWCSNNLTVSFAIQCYLYRKMSGDNTYQELEQACVDWLLGCNPWGKSMIYGLPANGDTPQHPHSSLSHLCNYPLDGALVDGPVYTSIFRGLKGLKLYTDDTYADFQSDLAVYHDDFGDYSTNEPTMDGTASLVYLLAAMEDQSAKTVHQKVKVRIKKSKHE
ncbi:glycoside hydrolase family 9 protein [Mucilaginibacter sp. RS28]|uniref:Glycoside hydrolase family 9 protein n=1 Tax=Mucilaginibacter straminoryzae TaxID=2932774 RepID=A0A9X2B9I7_9SPHI|nr:glycoside hydrolase family 9 protein [Mucilaginibacter straminoryzae]MCJ8209790.1 glycoside hydrolase family 9 protein [Mucilaginibacter straminoryzae]